MAEIQSHTHLFDPDLVQQQECFGRGVNEASPAGLAGFVLDKERNLAQVVARFAERVNEIRPGLAVIVLEVELVAVSEGTAGDLVGTDRSGISLSVLNELYGLGSNIRIGRGEAAVAELRLGLDVYIDG